jgi:hypothetical protein
MKTIKKEALKELQYYNSINRKVKTKDLQRFVIKSQKIVKGNFSKSIKIINNELVFSRGYYNTNFSNWRKEGLITSNVKDGFILTDLGKLYILTDTRAYEIANLKRIINNKNNYIKYLIKQIPSYSRTNNDFIDAIKYLDEFKEEMTTDKKYYTEILINKVCQDNNINLINN